MSKLVKIAKKIKVYRHKKEKNRLKVFKKKFGKAFANKFRKGGNPIYFDKDKNCPKLSRSIVQRSTMRIDSASPGKS
jgi:hypothetical protein